MLRANTEGTHDVVVVSAGPAARIASYDRTRPREFHDKWMFERLMSIIVARPQLLDRAARRLAAAPNLTDLSVGVAGDFVPASRVVRPSFAWQVLR